jgi:aminoglycoside phosphotransferase (APT) family kinase protein
MEGTADVRDVHRFDVAALERYLRERIEGFAGPLTVRQFRGGQSNPTYYLAGGGREYVLRRKPPGKLLPSAHAVDREYRVLDALAAHTSVPVPKPYVLCEDPTVIGTIFYVMDCVHGRIFRDANLPGATRAERGAIYDSMNDVLARLHTVDWRKLGLAEFGRPGNYYARQIHRWSQQYRASETEKIEAMEHLMEWLPKNIPASDDTTLVHGDYRPGNMIVHPTEPRVVAVLDWELSTLGDPLADVGLLLVYWAEPGDQTLPLGSAPTVMPGFPGRAEVAEAYASRSGRDLAQLDLYVAFASWKLAVILEGVVARHATGAYGEGDDSWRGFAEVVVRLADQALELTGSRGGGWRRPRPG